MGAIAIAVADAELALRCISDLAQRAVGIIGKFDSGRKCFPGGFFMV